MKKPIKNKNGKKTKLSLAAEPVMLLDDHIEAAPESLLVKANGHASQVGSRLNATIGPFTKDLASKYKLTAVQQAFLAAYCRTYNITAAARACDLHPQTHYFWSRFQDNSENYRKAFEEAQPVAKGYLEDEAVRRAAVGVSKPVFYEGKVVAFVPEYSDRLMEVMLKGALPHKYKEGSAQVQVNVPVQINITSKESEF